MKLLGATTEQRGEYIRARAYLRTSKTGKKLIRKIKKSPKQFKIIFVNGADKNEYTHYNRTIKWDHKGGAYMDDGTSVRSAALALAHEMGHAAQHLDGELNSVIKHNSRSNRLKVEEANLKKYETPIAKQLGEPTRSSYGGHKGLRRMNNSTHFITTYYSPRLFPDKYIWHHNDWPFVGTTIRAGK